MPRHVLKAPVEGSVWAHMMDVGQTVSVGQDVLVMESMKMEIAVVSDVSGTIVWMAASGSSMRVGETVVEIEIIC